MTISVFILDDHQVVRDGIRVVLERAGDITVVGAAGTAGAALAEVPRLRPDVAILDVRLPDGEGVAVCRELRTRTDPPPACLMLTSYSDDEALLGAVLAGAAGYMLKQVSGAGLVAAVRALAAGETLLDPSVADTVLARLRGNGVPGDPRYQLLSPQERRVLGLIAEGLTNPQIAVRLGLAEKTVKNYVSALLHKLGMRRRTEAAVYAAQLRGPLL